MKARLEAEIDAHAELIEYSGRIAARARAIRKCRPSLSGNVPSCGRAGLSLVDGRKGIRKQIAGLEESIRRI